MSALPTNLSLTDLRRAFEVYLTQAWPDGKRDAALPRANTLHEMLTGFEDEVRAGKARWSLRVGSQNYPHMKLVVEKALHCERLFLSVDTHDQVTYPDDAPDSLAWKAVQRKNTKLARRIEAAWLSAGLPTRQSLRDFVATCGDAPALEAPRVLVVDDEEDAACLYAMQIASRGFRVEVALDGESALKAMRRRRPDLVLLDYMMPELSGREVVELMRADRDLAKIPVIIATYAQTAHVDFSAADAVLAKPFSTKEVCAEITSLLAVKS